MWSKIALNKVRVYLHAAGQTELFTLLETTRALERRVKVVKAVSTHHGDS